MSRTPECGLSDSFDRDEALFKAMDDPFYESFEIMTDHQSHFKERGLSRLVSNMMEHSWRGHKWRKQFLQKLEEQELSDLSTDSDFDPNSPYSHLLDDDDNEESMSSSLSTTAEAGGDPTNWSNVERLKGDRQSAATERNSADIMERKEEF